MKLLRAVLITLSFAIFLSLGMQLGLHWGFAADPNSQEYPVVIVSQQTQSSTNPQKENLVITPMISPSITAGKQMPHNAMIITVDDSTKPVPRLVSIWYFVIYPDDDSITFMPVYPSIHLQHKEWNRQIASEFQLTADGLPEPSTLQKIRDLGILWHGDYVLFNQSAILEIAAFLGSPDPQYKISNIGALTTWEEDALTAIQAQAELIQKLCSTTSLTISAENMVTFITTLAPHLHTNISPVLMRADWRHLASYRNRLDCEFPTLTP